MALTAKEKEQLELGKKLQAFYESGYVHKKDIFWFSFLKGVVSGAGAFIGGTIVIALLLWLLAQFDELPLIGDVARLIRNTLQK